jgi:protein involved in polysaccharide export with SLBB domain
MIKSVNTFQSNSWLLPVLVLACVIPLDVILGAGRTRTRSTQKVYQAPEVVYKLSPFDLVRVSVYGQDDLACEQRISDKGILSMPLLGGILVGNSTVSEAEDLVEQVFVQQQYLRNPVVSISIQEFAPKMVTILGEVEQPGAVAIPPGQNGIPLLVAVAGAGGFTGTAKLTQVRVTRASRGAAEQQIDLVNAGKLLDSIETGQSRSIVVHPDDIVFVPKRVF